MIIGNVETKKHRGTILVYLLFVSLGLTLLDVDSAGQAQLGGVARKPFSVADSIEMTRLSGEPQFSPDATKVAVVIRKGNLETNTNQYSLLLWSTSNLLRSPAPEALVTMSSSSNRKAAAKTFSPASIRSPCSRAKGPPA